MAYLLAMLYLAAIILQPAAWIPGFSGKPVVEIIILLGFFACALGNFKRMREVATSTQARYFLGFIFVSIISLHEQGMAIALGEVGVKYLKYFLGYLLLMTALNDETKLRKALFLLVICGLIVAKLCIDLDATGVGVGNGVEQQVLNWRGAVQWVGTFGGTNTTGQLLLFLLAIAIGLTYKENAFVKKYGLLIIIGSIGYAFYLTHSRGGFVGLMAVLAYYAYTRMNIRWQYFLPMAIGIGILALVLKPEQEGRGIGQSSSPERIELLYQGLQMVKEYPILGVGSGQFAYNNQIRKTAHNIYLNTLAETGIIGFMLFILMYYVGIRELLKLRNNTEPEAISYRTTQPIILTLVGAATANFFLSAQHELPFIVLALVTLPGMNQGADFKVTISEYKYVLGFSFVTLAVIYFLIQIFFILFR